MLGTMDSEEMVEVALHNLESKFDIILVDLCDEPTNVATTAMQKSQQVFQIWSDSIPCLTSIPLSVANNIILSCPKDKMRYVIENKTCDDTMLGLDPLYKEYKFKRLSHCGLSYEIARISGLGTPLWKYPTMEATIGDFNLMILDIVTYLLDIDTTGLANGEVGKRRSIEDANNINESLNPLDSLNDITGKFKFGSKKSEDSEDVEEQEIDNEGTDNLFGGTDAVQEEPKKRGLFGRRK